MPHTPIVMMANVENPCFVLKSMQLGIRAYINKDEGPERLIYAIRQVIQGNAYLSPKSTKIALDLIQKSNKYSTGEQLSDKIATRLTWNATQREIDVIRGLIDGHSYKEIASTNYMTIDGVRYYVRSIYPKLGVSSRDQLVKVITR
jgi:DNA-binding NarL/FixJ family response regulator